MRRFFIALAFILLPSLALAQTILGMASVIDGDTIDIHGERIRLHGIDAVESAQPCWRADGTAWRCGKDAAFALADHLAGKSARCDVLDRDRYGRWVARCRVGDEDIGAWMVAEGWAMAYVKYSTDYVQQEARARDQSRGIWAARFDPPWDWRRRSK